LGNRIGSIKQNERVVIEICWISIPLVQSLPPLGVWTGLMTLPFATYLIMMFTDLPVSLPTALSEFFTPFLITEKAFLIVGLIILVCSIAHLKMKKKQGLVTSGTL
jgi:hypothetical protein